MHEAVEVSFADPIQGWVILRVDHPAVEFFTERHGSIGRVHLAMTAIQVGRTALQS